MAAKDFSVTAKIKSTRPAGKRLIVIERLFANGSKVGKSRVVCRTAAGKQRCTIRYQLPGGRIVGRGLAGKGTGPLKVRSSSGIYRGVSGEIQGKRVRKGVVLLTFHLDRAPAAQRASSSGLGATLHREAPADFSVLAKDYRNVVHKPFVTFRERLYRPVHHQVGHSKIVCEFKGRRNSCSARLTFRNGEIRAKGIVGDRNGGSVLPIRGGSGRYRGVKGAFLFKSISGKRSRETFKFRR